MNPKQTYKAGILETYYPLLFQGDISFKKEAFLKSELQKKPVDSSGNPIPWIYNSILDLFKERLNKEQTVFEYGSGFATVYFAQRVKQVTAIVHDRARFKKAKKKIKKLDNAVIKFYEFNQHYANAIVNEGMEKLYELVLIDGKHRAACAINSCAQLSPNGILIFNDSDQETHKEVFKFYQKNNFKHLTFSGLKPITFEKQATTIFYKSDNCFNI